jgi:hypothetical protein
VSGYLLTRPGDVTGKAGFMVPSVLPVPRSDSLATRISSATTSGRPANGAVLGSRHGLMMELRT